MKKTVAALAIAAVGIVAVAGCSSDADVVSQNISKDSEQFKIARRIVFYNGITDKYMMTIEGLCSIEPGDRHLEVTCKTAGDEYKKHYLGLSDNVTYFVEQIDGANVSAKQYKVIFKPEAIIPDIDHP